MGVDKHNLLLGVVLGIVLLGLYILFLFSRGNFAGEATFTGREPDSCNGENACEEGFVCQIVPDREGICVPSDRNLDTDRDGLKDYDEVVFYGTDYLQEDTDGDKLGDSREAIVWDASQYLDDSPSLVLTLTHSFKRLFGVEG